MKITLPAEDTGYASPLVGFGKAYADAVATAAKETSGHVPTIRVNLKDQNRKEEADVVNHRFEGMRRIVDRELMRYLEKNGGKIDAWPDPNSSFTMTFQPEEENDSLIPSPKYRFHYFGSAYDASGFRKSAQPQYYNTYEIKPRDHVQMIESGIKKGGRLFVENNPLLCLWELLKRIIIAICPVTGVLCAVYLAAVNFFGLDPECLKPVLASLDSLSTAIDALPTAFSVLATVVMMVLIAVPMLFYSITQLIYQVSGGSLVISIIAMVLIPVLSCVPAYYLHAIFAKGLRHVNLFRGIGGLCEFISLGLYSFTPLYRSRKRKDMEERKVLTDAVDGWHRAWYRYVCSHSNQNTV